MHRLRMHAYPERWLGVCVCAHGGDGSHECVRREMNSVVDVVSSKMPQIINNKVKLVTMTFHITLRVHLCMCNALITS